MPSLLKSPIATEGEPALTTSTSVEPLKFPAPSPKRIKTVCKLALAIAKSCLPSLLKSPTLTEVEPEPMLTSVEPLKFPAPSPNRIETVFEALLATAISCLPSLLKSPTATDRGPAPTIESGLLVKTETAAQAVPACTVSVKVLAVGMPRLLKAVIVTVY